MRLRKLLLFLFLMGISVAYSQEIYGSFCGRAGISPKLRTELETFIKETNIKKLNDWLISPSLVKQTYAAEGIIRLQNQGVFILSEDQITRIQKLKRKNKLIPTCSGCLLSERKVKDVLREFEMK